MAESESAYTPVFSTVLGRAGNVAPPSNFLLGERGVDTNDLFTSTGVRQRLRGRRGHVERLVGHVADDDQQSADAASTHAAVGVSGRVLAAAAEGPEDGRGATADHHRHAKSGDARSCASRESVVQTAAAVKQAYWTLKATWRMSRCSSGRSSSRRSWCAQNKAACRGRPDAAARSPAGGSRSGAAPREPDSGNAAAGDAEDRLRRLIMDPTRRVVLADAPRRRRTSRRRRPAAGRGRGRGARARPSATIWRARARSWTTSPTNVEFFSESEAAGRAARDVVSRQRARRHAVAADRRRFPARSPAALDRGYGNVLGQMFDRRLSDLERRADGELFARAQLRRGGPGADRRSSAGRRCSALRAFSFRSPRRSGRPPVRCTARPSASKPLGRAPR